MRFAPLLPLNPPRHDPPRPCVWLRKCLSPGRYWVCLTSIRTRVNSVILSGLSSLHCNIGRYHHFIISWSAGGAHTRGRCRAVPATYHEMFSSPIAHEYDPGCPFSLRFPFPFSAAQWLLFAVSGGSGSFQAGRSWVFWTLNRASQDSTRPFCCISSG